MNTAETALIGVLVVAIFGAFALPAVLLTVQAWTWVYTVFTHPVARQLERGDAEAYYEAYIAKLREQGYRPYEIAIRVLFRLLRGIEGNIFWRVHWKKELRAMRANEWAGAGNAYGSVPSAYVVGAIRTYQAFLWAICRVAPREDRRALLTDARDTLRLVAEEAPRRLVLTGTFVLWIGLRSSIQLRLRLDPFPHTRNELIASILGALGALYLVTHVLIAIPEILGGLGLLGRLITIVVLFTVGTMGAAVAVQEFRHRQW